MRFIRDVQAGFVFRWTGRVDTAVVIRGGNFTKVKFGNVWSDSIPGVGGSGPLDRLFPIKPLFPSMERGAVYYSAVCHRLLAVLDEHGQTLYARPGFVPS